MSADRPRAHAESGLRWQWSRLESLAPAEVLAVLQARQAVFVIEQRCIYPDIDDLDIASWHLLGRSASGALDAYLRVVPPGLRYPEPSIGRVLTRRSVRGHGLGRDLMHEGIRRTEREFAGSGIRISAQAHLHRFYRALGFVAVGEPYPEDGIPHLEMLRAP